jgi:hypothetical protein
MLFDATYHSPYEREYCTHPEICIRPDVLFLGSAVGLYAANYMYSICPDAALSLQILAAWICSLTCATWTCPRFPISTFF